MDFLKRATVHIKSIARDIEIRQLSGKAHAESIAAYRTEGKEWLGGYVTIKYAVPEWSDKTVDELAEMFTLDQMREIVDQVSELMGVDEKNSESIPNVSSSSR